MDLESVEKSKEKIEGAEEEELRTEDLVSDEISISTEKKVLKIQADQCDTKSESIISECKIAEVNNSFIKDDKSDTNNCESGATESKITSANEKEKLASEIGADVLKTISSEEGKKSETVLCEKNSDGAKYAGSDSLKSEESLKSEISDSNLHYENEVCIYTDPVSKCQFVWDDSKQEWIARDFPETFLDKDYEFDGKTYTYTDKETNMKYVWNEVKKDWEKKMESEEEKSKIKNPLDISESDMSQGYYVYENDTYTYQDPSDGCKYFWDKEKNAWFPKIDDDFLAHYQMNYGFVEPNAEDPKPEVKKEAPPPKEAEKRKAPQEPAWFEVGEETTKVYVSGLPLDITESEFVELMQKCGLVMRDVDTGKMKVKIYLDPETSLPKGDALCTYIKKESVDLSLELLDGSDVRGHRITVERAKFTMKGQYNPSLKPKKKRKKDKEKLKKIQEKLFAWMPDKLRGERSKHEKIIIVKNLFQPEIFDKDVKLILEYQQDLREECLKCGAVKKVVIFDRHPEGVAQINFKEFEAADACVQLLNGRWFGQRKITAEVWDGKTKYKITETDEEIKARLAKWEKFLEAGETEGKGENEKTEKTNIGDEDSRKKAEEENESDTVKTEDKTVDDESESMSVDLENQQEDSDKDTRSSVGSDYDTDDEAKT